MKRSSILVVVAAACLYACGTGVEPDAPSNAAESAAPAEPVAPFEARTVPANDARLGQAHTLGDGVAVENLTVWPVFADRTEDVGDFLTLNEAVERGLATIRERGNATVGSLEIENRADVPILACSGTLVKGGNQDRQLGRDLVILAGATQPVQAFCVEPGRWTRQRQGQDTGGRFEPAAMLAAKRVRASGQYDADQSQVWREVGLLSNVVYETQSPADSTLGDGSSQYYLSSTAEFQSLLASPTGTFLHAVEAVENGGVQSSATRRRMAATLEDFFEGFEGRRPVGFAYAIDGEPIGARTFAVPELLEGRLDSFLRTMCFEAELSRRRDVRAGREVQRDPAKVEALLTMVRGIGAADSEVVADAGHERVERRANGFGGNSLCSLKLKDGEGERLVPLTQDWTAPVRYSAEAREALGTLQALGYAGD